MQPRTWALGPLVLVLFAAGATTEADRAPGESAPASTASAPTTDDAAPFPHAGTDSAHGTSSTDSTQGTDGTGATAVPEEVRPAPPRSSAHRWPELLAEEVVGAVNRIVPESHVGLAVLDRETGSMLTSHNAGEPFPSASVMKLLIVTEVLRHGGWHPPLGGDRADLVAMLSGSADHVATALWDRHGGADIDRRAARLMGLTATQPPRDHREWELTRMSARDIVTVYGYIDSAMPGTAGDFVLDALARAPRIALDGFDQHYGLPAALPEQTSAVKQGWMKIDAGVVLHTTGIAGPDDRYAVALLTRQPAGTMFDTARDAVTAGMLALAPALRPRTGGGAHPDRVKQGASVPRRCRTRAARGRVRARPCAISRHRRC